MNTIVLYTSKYGSTKLYAEWLAEELGCDVAEAGSLNAQQLAEYDTVVVGGGVFASGVKGMKWLKKNYPQLSDKKLAVFAVGASPYEKANVQEVRNHSLGQELQAIPFFYLRGRWDEAHMTWLDRKLCGILRKEVEKKPQDQLVGWETALLEAHKRGDVATDWMSKDQLRPLIDWARG